VVIPWYNGGSLEGKETTVRWRAFVSANHHVLFVDRDTYVLVRGDPWLSSAFGKYAAEEVLKDLVGAAMEEWTKLC